MEEGDSRERGDTERGGVSSKGAEEVTEANRRLDC